jgi:hypothetical protein
MSSIFKPNLDKFSSKIFVAPANEYEVELGVPKYRAVKINRGDRAGQDMHIISFPSRIIQDTSGDTEFANKPLNIDFIVDENESSFDRLLKFIMTCKGIRPGADESDEEFRVRFGAEDFSVNTENGELGSGYANLQKARVVVSVDIRTQGDKQYQNFKGSRPF